MAEASDEPTTPFLERFGLQVVRKREDTHPAISQTDVHILDAAEHAGLRAIERNLVIRAAVAGGLSAAAAAIAEVLAAPILGADPDAATTMQLVKFWAIVGGVTGVAAVLEIAFLYVDSLRSVHDLTRVAGVPLFEPSGPRPSWRASAGETVTVPRAATELSSPQAAALVRAALELPEAPLEDDAQIDPLRETARWRVVLVGLLYKAKIGLTTFLVKFLVARVGGRAVARHWLLFVGVPVTAAWNGIVAFAVIREARLRTIGPSAAHRYLEVLIPPGTAPTAEVKEMAWRAVASSIVRTRELHPNVGVLLDELQTRIGPLEVDDLDVSARFLERLAEVDRAAAQLALRMLAVAAVLDGKVVGPERALVDEASAACDLPLPSAQMKRLRAEFVAGAPIGDATFAGLAEG